MSLTVGAGAALGGATASPSGVPWMSATELQSTFSGQTIDGHYPNGSTFTETYASGGRIDYRDDMRSNGGRWSIVDGTFCTIYDEDPTGGCFRVIRSGSNCFEFYFVARSEEEASRPRAPDWTARGWIADKSSTCTEGSNV